MKAWMLFLRAQACLFVCRLYLPEGAKTKLFPIISSACAANILCRNWLLLFQYLSDSFVLEGPKAGGHLGFKEQKLEEKSFFLEESLPKVLEPVSEFEKEAGKKIPVIAAGGIFDGQDIHRFLSMGVSGLQMGARFVATEECDAHQKVKEAFVQAIEEDIEIIKSPVDFPGRAIRSPFLEDVKKGLRKPFKCPFQCISTAIIQKVRIVSQWL